MFQLSDWMKEKYKTATDESYRDLTNLLPKLKKHEAFEAELQANKRTLDAINKVRGTLHTHALTHRIILS